jgi:hypothetical protein
MAIFPPVQQPPPPQESDFEPYGQEQGGYDQGGYSPYDQQMPQFGQMGQSMPYPNQSAQLIQWILNFKREVTTPLRHMWRGEEQDVDGNWCMPEGGLNPVMNELGITFCVSYIESFCNPVFLTSNFSEDDLNYRMKEAGHAAINSICCRYKEFGMSKLSIPRIVEEINSKIHAILLGARNNGYRLWMSSTHQSHEVISNQQQGGEKKGFFNNFSNFFTR